MNPNNKRTYLKNILFPCLIVSSLAGIFTGGLIFAFKLTSVFVIRLSGTAYTFVRAHPAYLPLLMLTTVGIGMLAALILKYDSASRGGCIPTAIAILRGLITFHWLKNICSVFISSMLTYLGGIPLGTEGPSVQIGTSVGRGTVRLFGKKHAAWDRYVMTGSACAGFSCATGAPITGIFFAFEEAHRRISPMLFMTVASAVISGYTTTGLLCEWTGMPMNLFSLSFTKVLPLRYLGTAIAVGLISGIVAILFTKLYQAINRLFTSKLANISMFVKIPVIFAATALIGFASSGFIGTGHLLIEELMSSTGVWYLLIIYLAVRALMLIIANTAGVTGGLFIPSLAFGALVGALCANALVKLGALPQEYSMLLISIGMASFLAASSRTPIMAIAFAAEALGCILNLIPVIAGVTFACLITEATHMICFTDTVIEAREKVENKDKTATVVDEHVTVMPGAFVVGKEIHDVLWPPTCTILSVSKQRIYSAYDDGGLQPKDILHLHYISYDVSKTKEQLEALVGKQDHTDDAAATCYTPDENHQIPQL